MRLYLFSVVFCLSLLVTAMASDEKYWLCGSDEDGCSADSYNSCLCMPDDGAVAFQPYCLNFDEVSCKPLSAGEGCAGGIILKDQPTCLAVAFQSEPEPPCALTEKSFCQKNHIALCGLDGGEESCRSS